MMIELSEDNLEVLLEQNKKVFVLYGAAWCGNCRMIKPKIKNFAEEFKDVQFVYADAEQYPGSRKFAEINNLPTFATFQDGKLVNQGQGNKVEKVKELIDEIASH